MKKIKALICLFFRHSRIVSNCFGYKYCGRCEVQVGDSLGGYWDDTDKVVIGHNCKICKKNYKKMTFLDKFLVPNPFKEDKK